jgi:hypothetical protein
MATFKSYGTASIGTSEVAIYTPTQKSIVIGLAISNIYGSVMPITIKLFKSGSATVNIAKSRRVESGTYVDLMAGNKLVIENGDVLKAFAGDAAAFDVTVSVLEGVT